MDSTSPNPKNGKKPAGALFPATHWTQIAVIRDDAHPEAAAALDQLCRTYLPAIESYIRWLGIFPGQSRELATEFLAEFIHQDSLRRVDPTKGRFRSYMAVAIRHFLFNRRRSAASQPAHLNLSEASDVPTRDEHAVTEFDRVFAQILVGNAITATRAKFAGKSLEPQLPVLLPYLGADPPEDKLRDVALRLGISDDSIYQNFKRLRDELFRQLREETRRHLGPQDDVAEEMMALLRAYARE